jgi:hypothetical protein
MAAKSPAEKLKLKSGQQACIINMPHGYLQTLAPFPEGIQFSYELNQSNGRFDWLQLFVKNQAELDELAPQAIKVLKPESLLWVSFPKGSSKIQTDLTRDKGWDTLQQADLKWVNLISIDDTWSAFCLRPYCPGEERQSWF